jgi:hypothetical protein
MLLILGGSFKIIDALWAFKYDDDLSEGVQTVIFERDLAVWGWVWLVLGFGLIAAGFALLRGAEWARWVAMVVAAVAAFVSFTWIFYQPLWAILSVTISMLVFYALAVYGRPAWEGTGDG